MDYNKICFVIMPFGKKKVGDKEVDFDFIYDNVFKPAVAAVDLPEGGKLDPRRTDKDYFSGDISQEMYQYIEYSRFALADISGLNANVFYELGVRHRSHESGTAIFRQETGPPPFDIGQIKAFPYGYEPQDKVAESVELVRKVLAESLVHNSLDSPPMRALLAQRAREQDPARGNIEPTLVEADNALRQQDWTKAVEKFSEALAISPDETAVLFKRGLVYRDRGVFDKALADFDRVTQLSRNYAEAYREKGIAENKIYNKAKDAALPTGEEALRKAVELKPDDFDALSSLGGVYKRQGRIAEAAECYVKATESSKGNTYPLLNAITLKAQAEGRFELDKRHRFMLERARRSLQSQVESGYNPPWSAFDLAQLNLYTGDGQKFLDNIDEGLLVCTHAWQPETFRKTLELLTSVGVSLPGLDEGIAKLKEAEEFLAV
jgi:tetratricopeptide (TPR) repeat protein